VFSGDDRASDVRGLGAVLYALLLGTWALDGATGREVTTAQDRQGPVGGLPPAAPDVERKGQRELVTVSHWNKLLKGALVRHVVDGQVDDPEALVDFEHPQGYVYRPDLTVQDGNTIDIALVAPR